MTERQKNKCACCALGGGLRWGAFCCVPADADKRAYWQYHELLLQLVRPGGLIIADNVLFYGKVVSPLVRGDGEVQLSVQLQGPGSTLRFRGRSPLALCCVQHRQVATAAASATIGDVMVLHACMVLGLLYSLKSGAGNAQDSCALSCEDA